MAARIGLDAERKRAVLSQRVEQLQKHRVAAAV
jgi:hypothetical protein